MLVTLRLFKAVEIKDGDLYAKEKLVEEWLARTIRRGFVFSPKVIANYPPAQLNRLIAIVEEELGLTREQMNATLHKSWKKVEEAPLIQLVMEQLIHYMTTYGFEHLGIYDEDSVYIPNEVLEIPELEKGIRLTVIKGYTEAELKEKLLELLGSGIALKEQTVIAAVELATQVGIEKEIEQIKNKEVLAILYEQLKIVPKNPVEFLRYLLYRTIDSTLLIKDKATIEKIKECGPTAATTLFQKYKKLFGHHLYFKMMSSNI